MKDRTLPIVPPEVLKAAGKRVQRKLHSATAPKNLLLSKKQRLPLARATDVARNRRRARHRLIVTNMAVRLSRLVTDEAVRLGLIVSDAEKWRAGLERYLLRSLQSGPRTIERRRGRKPMLDPYFERAVVTRLYPSLLETYQKLRRAGGSRVATLLEDLAKEEPDPQAALLTLIRQQVTKALPQERWAAFLVPEQSNALRAKYQTEHFKHSKQLAHPTPVRAQGKVRRALLKLDGELHASIARAMDAALEERISPRWLSDTRLAERGRFTPKIWAVHTIVTVLRNRITPSRFEDLLEEYGALRRR
jgi:hypothetical protein